MLHEILQCFNYHKKNVFQKTIETINFLKQIVQQFTAVLYYI